MKGWALIILAVACVSCGGPSTRPAAPAPSPQPTLGAVPTAAVAQATAEPTPPPGYISQAELGDAWPLTVADGVLECRNPRGQGAGAVVFVSGGTVYAVNGTAMGTKRYRDIASIWRDNPAVAGLKIDISPLIERGLALCTR